MEGGVREGLGFGVWGLGRAGGGVSEGLGRVYGGCRVWCRV